VLPQICGRAGQPFHVFQLVCIVWHFMAVCSTDVAGGALSQLQQLSAVCVQLDATDQHSLKIAATPASRAMQLKHHELVGVHFT